MVLVKVDTIITTPITQERSVVCSRLKPKDTMISGSWLLSEARTLLNPPNNAKSHVLGSVKASIILPIDYKNDLTRDMDDTDCSFLKCLFSTPVWFSFVIRTQHKNLS